MIEHQIVYPNWNEAVQCHFFEHANIMFFVKYVGGPSPTEPQKVKKAGRVAKKIKPERTSAKKGDAGVMLPVAESTPVTEEQKAIILKMAAEKNSNDEINAMLPTLTKRQIRETRKSASHPGIVNTDPNLFKDA
ncbi:MAG: hypothetical protein IPK50_13885 [Fibrobacterota bacterium]|nr:MAG: hypothetical protein IPK50_13885 [Fibrobacterota bacterium]